MSLLLAGVYTFFMYPVSYFGWGDGVSINYSFLLIPVISVAIYGFNPGYESKRTILYLVIYMMIFIGALVLRESSVESHVRQFLSFLSFISIFGMSVANKRLIDIDSFKQALIGISIILSSIAIYKYINLCVNADVCAGLKALIGSQRHGFLYVLAIWVIAWHRTINVYNTLIKYGVVSILSIGLALTYSRNSILGLWSSIVGFIFFRYILKQRRESHYAVEITITYVLIVLMASTYIFSNVGDVYISNAVPESILADVSNANSSVGYRLSVWRAILQYIFQNPLFGSGYNGVWVILDGNSGSAHSQYLDVLFRVGIVGFILYVSVLYMCGKKLKQIDGSLFIGFLGVLVMGIFHETFKLAQGAFVLAFIYALAVNEDRNASPQPHMGR